MNIILLNPSLTDFNQMLNYAKRSKPHKSYKNSNYRWQPSPMNKHDNKESQKQLLQHTTNYKKNANY